jgi:hypothetical protein
MRKEVWNIQVSITQPLNGFITISNSTKHDFGVEVVRQLGHELGLDR